MSSFTAWVWMGRVTMSVTSRTSRTSINGVMAMGMTFVILTGGIDLSVGAVLALAMCVLAMVVKNLGLDQWFGLFAALLVGSSLSALPADLLAEISGPVPAAGATRDAGAASGGGEPAGVD